MADVQHRDADRDHNGGKGSHPFLGWGDVASEASRTALGASVPRGIAVFQVAGDRPGFYGSEGGGEWAFLSEPLGNAETGWLSGLDITASIANPTTKYDVAAGTIRVQGINAPVAAGPFLDVDPLNLITEEFTVNMVNSSAQLVQLNRQSTPTERRTAVPLQTVNHPVTTLGLIDATRHLSEHMPQALADYVLEAGPLNTGNAYTAAGANLKVQKSVGSTLALFLRGATDLNDPDTLPNPAINPVQFFQLHIQTNTKCGKS